MFLNRNILTIASPFLAWKRACFFFCGDFCARVATGNDVSGDVEDLGGSGLQGSFRQMKSSFAFFAFAGTSIFVGESVRELRIDQCFNE